MIDRVAAKLGGKLVEVPVGFKWFVDGLIDGSLGFGGEESAGASFLRRDGRVDHRQGRAIMGLLAAEIPPAPAGPAPVLPVGDRGLGTPSTAHRRPGRPRAEGAAGQARSRPLRRRDPGRRAGAGQADPGRGNDAAIGGIKVAADNGWFAARPSGTEDVYKIYAESFLSAEHLAQIQAEAQAAIDRALA